VQHSGGGDWLAAACGGAISAIVVCWLTDYTIRYTAVLLWMAMPFALLVVTRHDGQLAETSRVSP
jgi:hypothetical protein